MTESTFPRDYFAKRAKELRSLVGRSDAEACDRVRRVYADVGTMSDLELSGERVLMRAQHVVAVEHGFLNWKALLDSSSIEARLAITMAENPELNSLGMGPGQAQRRKPPAEQEAIANENRRILRASAARVAETVTWLRENVEPTASMNPVFSSYGIKDIAEEDIGYITNGTFIAAGIIARYPHVVVPGSLNVRFGMSAKSLREINTRRTSPDDFLKRFTPRAIGFLANRGLVAQPVGSSGVELAWRDNGDLRTLRIGTTQRSPFIARIFVDCYSMLAGRRAAKILELPRHRYDYYTVARPVRPKGEISVLLDELESALEWALGFDATSMSQSPPPFETSGWESWPYVWSKRAFERIRPGRREALGAA